jgi:hypothetical protein
MRPEFLSLHDFLLPNLVSDSVQIGLENDPIVDAPCVLHENGMEIDNI